MRLLHAPEFEQYTLLLDERYTYSFSEDYVAALRNSAVSVSKWASTGCDTDIIYNHYSTRRWNQGSVVLNWTITHEALDGDVITIRLNTKAAQQIPLRFTGGRSQAINLVPDYLTVQLLDDDNALSERFRFEVQYQPVVPGGMVDLLSGLKALDARNGLASLLFTDWKPYSDAISELHDLWRYSDESNVQLAAALLGYAYKCEQIRRGIPLSTTVSTLRRFG
jgi:hypothetical protein